MYTYLVEMYGTKNNKITPLKIKKTNYSLNLNLNTINIILFKVILYVLDLCYAL